MTVKQIDLYVDNQGTGISPTYYGAVIKGVTTLGVPFNEEIAESSMEDLVDAVSAALVTNAITCGITDDIE